MERKTGDETYTLSAAQLIVLLHRAFREGVVYGYIDNEPSPAGEEPHAAWEEDGVKRWCQDKYKNLPQMVSEVCAE